jgi:hypothetical protein
MTRYDTQEAQWLLVEAAAISSRKSGPDQRVLSTAIDELLSGIAAVGRVGEIMFVRDRNSRMTGMSTPQGDVRFIFDGGAFVVMLGNIESARFVFPIENGVFVSDEPETEYRHPVPGELKVRRRSPVAILIEAGIKALGLTRPAVAKR